MKDGCALVDAPDRRQEISNGASGVSGSAPRGQRRFALGRIRAAGMQSYQFPLRHYEPTGRANARPMTGSAKQSGLLFSSIPGLLRRFAPRNDETAV
jgi:hypothetical protein